MVRKSNAKGHIASPPQTNLPTDNDTNDLYRKRLRSWKKPSTSVKSNHSLSMINDEDIPFPKSTIYTFPFNMNNNYYHTSISNTILSESLTTESAFYGPSISNTSIQTNSNLNNNHVTTWNVKDNKRKISASSCESLSSQSSHTTTPELLPNSNDEKNNDTKQSYINNLQLTYHQNPIKRSRLSPNNSIITNSPLIIDDNTIDINHFDQYEPLSSSINNSNSMEAAVKMVQPIVDIIFNAFEDQLKTLPNSSIKDISSYQYKSPMTLTSPARPLVLHAVNFNIQLTTKNPHENQISKEQYITNATLNENGYLQSISLTELKQKVISSILSNNLISNNTNQRKRHKLKRFVQLAVFGVSVLCGYLLL